MTLKEKLEAIWNDPRIHNPVKINKWSMTDIDSEISSKIKKQRKKKIKS